MRIDIKLKQEKDLNREAEFIFSMFIHIESAFLTYGPSLLTFKDCW